MIFFNVVFPVMLVFLAGYGIQKWKRLDIKSISTIAIYILSPALVFRTFYKVNLNEQYLLMIIFACALLFTMIIINKLYSKLREFSEATESGLILATAFMNSGNYGTPIVLFAYGKTGFDFSISFLVIQSMLMNFFGVYYAARGQSGIHLAIKKVLEMPATYATILALGLNIAHLHIPNNLFGDIKLLADAAIPVVMLVLGMQLAEIKLSHFDWPQLTYGVLLRLIISPFIAACILGFLPMDPLLKKVLILSAAMPSAATTTMYAVQFNTKPKLVSSITLITTLISIITITLLLIILT